MLVCVYLLRQKTRPTCEEAHMHIGHFLTLHHSKDLVQSLFMETGADKLKMNVANVTDNRPLDAKVFNDYIRNLGGRRYLDNPAAFEVVTHDFESGNPPELTKLAFVFDRNVETPVSSNIKLLLERGTRWEDLGHWGDAALCYAIAMRVGGVHPELMAQLGKALMHFPRELAASARALELAADALPRRADVQAALGHCFIMIADHEEVPIQNLDRKDARRMGIARLETAAHLDPSDMQIAEELAAQRRHTNQGLEDSFYD